MSEHPKILFRKFWKSLIWAGFIGVVLFIPEQNIPKLHPFNFAHLDKVAHIFLFLVMQFLLLWDIKQARIISNFLVSPAAIVSMYALFTEGVQYLLVKGRNGSWYDFLADIAGCILGVIFFRIFLKLRGRFFPQHA